MDTGQVVEIDQRSS